MEGKRSVQVAIRKTILGGIFAASVIGVAASCSPQSPISAPASTRPVVSAAPAVSVAPALPVVETPSVAPPIVPVADVQPVTRVIDGDTFTTPEGKVRVLVMDSCESGTQGGDLATSDAHLLLDGNSVTLTAQPGHNKDGYGRLLRYVTLPDGRDYADVMLGYDHTAVYAGKNDALPAKVAEGRAADTDGRTCDPAPTTETPAPADDNGSSLGDSYDHDRNHRDGALTGGYCARKWWC